MTSALFITTETVDCDNHVRAWESAYSMAIHHRFNHLGLRNDWQAVELAKEHKPDVIFYIGAVQGIGIPRYGTFHDLRKIAPVIHLCSDAMDQPWHGALKVYRNRECFDLQVSLDGAKAAPVDLSTLTPVDPLPFISDDERTIRCGFSGTIGRWNRRSEIINALEWFGGLTVRKRAKFYEEHSLFMRKCQMILNTSWTGSGERHHIKGRVLEAGWAGCALLEHADSPIGEWFPPGCWIPWETPRDIAEIISEMDEESISKVAKNLSEVVREKYTANRIYGEMLKHVGIAV